MTADAPAFRGIALSRSRSAPLFMQLADALAYSVSTGRLESGTRLPSLRDGQEIWGVNMHTVRRAYAELQARGLASTSPRSGTTVGGLPSRGDPAVMRTIEDDIREFLIQTERRRGIPRGRVAALATTIAAAPPATIGVVECSDTLSAMLAAQISAYWGVETSAVTLGQDGLPSGPLVSSYFHYNELRASLDRRKQLFFVHIRPALRFLATLATHLPDHARWTLLERDESLAHNVVRDLRIHFGDELDVKIRVAESESDLKALPHAPNVIVSPGNWDLLRGHTDAFDTALLLEYEIVPEDLAQLGVDFGWAPRGGA